MLLKEFSNQFNQSVFRNKKALSTGRNRTPNTAAIVLIAATGTWGHFVTTQVQVVAIVLGTIVLGIAHSRRPIVA